MAVTLDTFPVDIQPEYTRTLLTNAFEQSLVGQVVPSQPLTLGGQVIPIYDGGIEVGLTAEATKKPTSDFTGRSATLSTAKVATIVVVSREAALANPANMLDIVEQDLRNSISRAVDSLVLHGRDPRGTDYTGTNVPVVGAGNAATVAYDDADVVGTLLEAYQAAAGEGSDPSAWLFDPRLRADLVLANATTDVNGNPVRPALPNLNTAAANVAGLPALYGRSVSGRSSQATDLGVRGIVGDWSKVRYGFVERLDIVRSTEATVGGVSMFETNQVALLVEATLGWTCLDQSAFSVIEAAGS